MLKPGFYVLLLAILLLGIPIQAQGGDPRESQLLTAPNQENGQTEIMVGLFVTQIRDFDEQSENFTIEAILQLTWHDHRQSFDATAFGANSKFLVEIEIKRLMQLGAVWFPELYITTQQGSKTIESQILQIDADGTMVYRERFSATIQDSTIDFHEFPFDRQMLQIPIESLIHPIDEVVLTIDEDFTGLGQELGIEDWLIEEFNVETLAYEEAWAHSEFSRFVYAMPASRRIEYYVFSVVVPLLLILVIAWATFFLPDYDRRIDGAMGAMLLIIAFQFTLNDDLPKLSYLTFFDTMMFITFFLTAFAVLVNIYGKWLVAHGNEKRGRQITRILVWLFPLGFVCAIGVNAWLFL